MRSPKSRSDHCASIHANSNHPVPGAVAQPPHLPLPRNRDDQHVITAPVPNAIKRTLLPTHTRPAAPVGPCHHVRVFRRHQRQHPLSRHGFWPLSPPGFVSNNIVRWLADGCETALERMIRRRTRRSQAGDHRQATADIAADENAAYKLNDTLQGWPFAFHHRRSGKPTTESSGCTKPINLPHITRGHLLAETLIAFAWDRQHAGPSVIDRISAQPLTELRRHGGKERAARICAAVVSIGDNHVWWQFPEIDSKCRPHVISMRRMARNILVSWM